MSRWIEPTDVTFARREVVDGHLLVEARVKGRTRQFIVDHNRVWARDWFCTCGRAPSCAHIRAVKEALG